MDLVDELILCDDASKDSTFELAKQLGIKYCIRHEKIKVMVEIKNTL